MHVKRVQVASCRSAWRYSVLLQVKFERAVFETPQLLTDKEFPSSITLLGTSVDLTSLKVCFLLLAYLDILVHVWLACFAVQLQP